MQRYERVYSVFESCSLCGHTGHVPHINDDKASIFPLGDEQSAWHGASRKGERMPTKAEVICSVP